MAFTVSNEISIWSKAKWETRTLCGLVNINQHTISTTRVGFSFSKTKSQNRSQHTHTHTTQRKKESKSNSSNHVCRTYEIEKKNQYPLIYNIISFSSSCLHQYITHSCLFIVETPRTSGGRQEIFKPIFFIHRTILDNGWVEQSHWHLCATIELRGCWRQRYINSIPILHVHIYMYNVYTKFSLTYSFIQQLCFVFFL